MVAILNPSPESVVADRILRVAKSIVGAGGEASLRIDDVIDGAAVKAPVIYRHFGSREGLVQSAHLARFMDNLTALAELFSANSMSATNASEFRAGLDRVLDVLLQPESLEVSATRMEVLAAGLKRPQLSWRIRELQGSTLAGPIAAFEFAKSEGWVRSDIAMEEFVPWAVSVTIGQSFAAKFVGEPQIIERWARIHRRAIHTVLFGDKA